MARGCTDVLCPLLGLIVNISTITSPVIGVRVVICQINDNCNYPKGIIRKINNQNVCSSCVYHYGHALVAVKGEIAVYQLFVIYVSGKSLGSVCVCPCDFTPLTSYKGKKKSQQPGLVFVLFVLVVSAQFGIFVVCAPGLYNYEVNPYYILPANAENGVQLTLRSKLLLF